MTVKGKKDGHALVSDPRIKNLIQNLNDPIMLRSAEKLLRDQETQGSQYSLTQSEKQDERDKIGATLRI